MTPTTSHIPLRSFSCSECDCGACANDAVAAVQEIRGVIHARLDRRNTGVIVRYDAEVVDEEHLRATIGSGRLTLR